MCVEIVYKTVFIVNPSTTSLNALERFWLSQPVQ